MKRLFILCGLIACGPPVPDSGAVDAGQPPVVDAGDAPVRDAGPPPDLIGGNRPVGVLYPDGYDASQSWPLIIVLHGYTAFGAGQDTYLGVSARGSQYGFITLAPDGNRDGAGNRFWNATETCCDFGRTGVDDLAYITGLIDEAVERLNVDPNRVYLAGHSNGGFMASRIACDAADKVTAVLSIAGSEFSDPSRCQPSRPVGLIQVHGTLDSTIAFAGGRFQGGGGSYPGAETVVERFRAHNACPEVPAGASSDDFDNAVAGDETELKVWGGCEGGADVQLWSMVGSGHVPAFTDGFRDALVETLLGYR